MAMKDIYRLEGLDKSPLAGLYHGNKLKHFKSAPIQRKNDWVKLTSEPLLKNNRTQTRSITRREEPLHPVMQEINDAIARPMVFDEVVVDRAPL